MSGIGALERPKKQSLDRAAAESLRNAITSGQIAPGARLTEIRLAEQFQLSRGTVRAALHRLVSEGLVVQRPYSGWEVTSLTPQDAWDLATLRSSLEALAARLAAERMDAAGRKAVEDAFAALAEACGGDDWAALVAADMAFHRAVVSLSGNRRLVEHYDLIANQVRLYIASSNRLILPMGSLLDRHRALVEPLLAGDAERAEKAFRDLAMRSGAEIVAHLEKIGAEGEGADH